MIQTEDYLMIKIKLSNLNQSIYYFIKKYIKE